MINSFLILHLFFPKQRSSELLLWRNSLILPRFLAKSNSPFVNAASFTEKCVSQFADMEIFLFFSQSLWSGEGLACCYGYGYGYGISLLLSPCLDISVALGNIICFWQNMPSWKDLPRLMDSLEY